VPAPGASRRQIASTLNAAYADGLLSHDTFCHRLDQLFGARLVDPIGLIGDLNLRRSRYDWRARLTTATAAMLRALRLTRAEPIEEQPRLLALDWSSAQSELLLGRDHRCDVVLSSPGVSRRHARLLFRDGAWVLQDLDSTNGTVVNGVSVGRCELRPGDRLVVGGEQLTID
jgi:FHA domain